MRVSDKAHIRRCILPAFQLKTMPLETIYRLSDEDAVILVPLAKIGFRKETRTLKTDGGE